MKTLDAKGHEIDAPLGRRFLALLSEGLFDIRVDRVEMSRGNAECYERKGVEVQSISPDKAFNYFRTFCGIPIVVDYGMPDDLIRFHGEHQVKGVIYNLATPKI